MSRRFRRWSRPGATFADRRDAGRRLAAQLAAKRITEGVVVGLARGGVEVGAEVAGRLKMPLDALGVRKIGHPLQPEYAIGAVTPDGGVHLRPDTDLDPSEVAAATSAALADAAALDGRLHAGRPAVDLAGRTCVLVDDGLATGATMAAAVSWARRRGAARVIVAVPVGAPATVEALGQPADGVVCLEEPEALGSVGEWYDDFGQVSDDRVVELLADADPRR
jgi:putative phosphoribosyl transferase